MKEKRGNVEWKRGHPLFLPETFSKTVGVHVFMMTMYRNRGDVEYATLAFAQVKQNRIKSGGTN
jgi:hypothetical protein